MVLNKDEISITNALISEGVLREGIKVQHFLLEEKEGEKCIQIDFNYLFEEQLQSYGTSGERIFIGSVCNTFLSAYDADFIKITVDENILSSGHAIYDSYLSFFTPGVDYE